MLWLFSLHKQDANYDIEIYEGTAVVTLYFQSTIQLTCPDCYVELELESHVGLTVNRCSLRFTDTSPQGLQLRAVPTPGSYSRIVTLKFHSVVSLGGPVWRGYSVPDIAVTI